MTWTWHDDDPATALSAENMQTRVELRLRALEAGGASVAPTDVLLFSSLTLANGWRSATLGGDGFAPARLFKQAGRGCLSGFLVAGTGALLSETLPNTYLPSVFGDSPQHDVTLRYSLPMLPASLLLVGFADNTPASLLTLAVFLADFSNPPSSGSYVALDGISWPLAVA